MPCIYYPVFVLIFDCWLVTVSYVNSNQTQSKQLAKSLKNFKHAKYQKQVVSENSVLWKNCKWQEMLCWTTANENTSRGEWNLMSEYKKRLNPSQTIIPMPHCKTYLLTSINIDKMYLHQTIVHLDRFSGVESAKSQVKVKILGTSLSQVWSF